MELEDICRMAETIRNNVGHVIVGKKEVVDQLLVALLASGHALLEDVPGTGKTLLAKALARSIACSFKRIQFTPDLLPSDVTGINFFNPKEAAFVFRPGPVFAGILLADEINRATPRTQSSLLECMEERQATIDGETYPLPQPFLVLATQNPIEQQGTFPLPEAQLDRFLLKIGVGYPTAEEGVAILQRFNERNPLETLQPVADSAAIVEAQAALSRVRITPDLLAYIVALAEATRRHPDVATGVSPRGTQSLLKASQAYALLQQREFVSPDDIKAMAKPVLAHRLVMAGAARLRAGRQEETIDAVLREVPVPTEPSAAEGVR